MTYAEYAAINAINWSKLKHMRTSALRYKYSLTAPDEDTTDRLKGRATHTAVFEPHLFDATYPIFKGKTRRGKEWDAFVLGQLVLAGKCTLDKDGKPVEEVSEEDLAAAGKCILKLNERDAVFRMRDAIVRHPIVKEYLSQGEGEVTLQWTDAATGLKCKGRPDFISASRPAILDLKAVQTLELRKLQMMADDQGYPYQAAFYAQGLTTLNRDAKLPSVMIAAEIAAPHDVAVLAWDFEAMVVAEQTLAKLLQRVVECARAKHWPGRHEGEMTITMPAYKFAELNEDEELEDYSQAANS